MQFSIVVVTWNCAGALSTLVESMNRHLGSEPTLVVVDNASTDDPADPARRWRGETRFVRNEANVGFARACNAGLALADGDAVVLLNPDTQLVDDSLAALAERALELVALVGPRVLGPDGRPQASASGPPVGIWPWVRAILPGRVTPALLLAKTEPWRLARTVEVSWLSGSCIAAPLERLRAVGGLDESLELFAEDLELGLRARAAGVRSYFAPDVATIVHEGDVSTRQRFADGGLAAAVDAERHVLAKHYGERVAAAARRTLRLNLTLRVAAKTLVRSPTRRRDAQVLAALRR